ncbi:MAG: hypothetical protein JXM70_22535 [Pirellulales bacterium]|nr:hypothetical protein [Pirellulales bacterium]
MDPAITAVMRAQDAALCSQIQFAVADKALDNMKLQGEAMNRLLEDAAQVGKDLNLGKKFDAVG